MHKSNFMSKLICFIVILLFFSAFPLFGYAKVTNNKEVKLIVDLATPMMQADIKQNAFIKISLEGYKLDKAITSRAPTNIAIVLDKSGSMQGSKIQSAKKAAITAINLLGKDDIVSIVTYDTTVDVVVPSTKVSDKSSIIRLIEQIQVEGSTALFAGVSKGASELRKFLDKNRVNRVILLSDGLANVGPQTPHELGQLGLSLSKEGISVTTIGLGLGYNEDLMTQLAGYSDGNHAFVEKPNDLAKIFELEFGDVLSVIAQGVNIEIQCADGVKPLRILGRDAEIVGSKVSARFNQLYSEQEKYFVLEVEIPESKVGLEREIVSVNLSYSDMTNNRMAYLSGKAKANFTRSKSSVISNINKSAYEDSVEQVANEVSKEAISLRDKGDVDGAKELLKSNASFLRSESKLIQSEKLQEQEVDAIEEARVLDDDAQWNKNRKSSKAKIYKREKQQSY